MTYCPRKKSNDTFLVLRNLFLFPGFKYHHLTGIGTATTAAVQLVEIGRLQNCAYTLLYQPYQRCIEGTVHRI
ncbi:hypothetical protein X975_24680, partial [Stegodyphus mimosarum]